MKNAAASRIVGQPETGYLHNSPPLPNLKSSRNQINALPGGLMPPGFPVFDCRRIDAQLRGHLPLRETEPFPPGCKALWN
jgi:hypothetical protein